jgi:hypothetical protein
MYFKRSQLIISFIEFEALVASFIKTLSVPKLKQYEIFNVSNDIVHFIKMGNFQANGHSK